MDNQSRKKILIVDDQEKNIKILAAYCRKLEHEIFTARNGREAIDQAVRYRPDLILMDVMMPEMDGFEATATLKAMEETKHIPVIMVTALDSREDRLTGIGKGADDFLTKPIDGDELLLRLRNNLRNKEYHDFLVHHKEILEEQVAERTMQIKEGYIDTILRLTLASEYKDDETGSHIKRTSYYTRTLAEKLGLDSDFLEAIFYAAPMHDIGKVAIPDAILLKNGPLDKEEWQTMQTHTTIGARILAGSRSPYLNMAVDIALSHHERWDGSGYPKGLKEDAIPLSGRIMNIADQYDALRSPRPYKPAFDHDTTCKILIEGDGRTMPGHFDPRIHEAFRDLHREFAGIYDAHKDD